MLASLPSTPLLIAATIALAGVTLLWMALRRSARKHPMCPVCGYDTSGQLRTSLASPEVALALTCPECGTTVSSPAAWLARRRPRLLVLVLAGLLLVAAPVVTFWPSAETMLLRLCTPSHTTADRVVFGPFTATLERLAWDWGTLSEGERYSDFCDDRLTITGPDGVILVFAAPSLQLGSACENLPSFAWRSAHPDQPLLLIGRGEDINADSSADLLVDVTLRLAANGGPSDDVVLLLSSQMAGGKPTLRTSGLGNGRFRHDDATERAVFMATVANFSNTMNSGPLAASIHVACRGDAASGRYRYDPTLTSALVAPQLAALLRAAPENPEDGEGNRQLLLARAATMLSAADGSLALAHVRTFGPLCQLPEAAFRRGLHEALSGTFGGTRPDGLLRREWLAAQPESFRLWLGPLRER